LTRDNEVSGDVEMRISNSSSFADAEWESLASEKPWTLGECDAGICRVYAQFRDGADNESFVIYDEIALTAQKIYLPIVLRGD
jgi:predicted nucleotidyltransferase